MSGATATGTSGTSSWPSAVNLGKRVANTNRPSIHKRAPVRARSSSRCGPRGNRVLAEARKTNGYSRSTFTPREEYRVGIGPKPKPGSEYDSLGAGIVKSHEAWSGMPSMISTRTTPVASSGSPIAGGLVLAQAAATANGTGRIVRSRSHFERLENLRLMRFAANYGNQA